MRALIEGYKRLDSGQVIKETKHYSPEGRIYAKTTIFYNKEGVAYKIVDWVQNIDRSITYNTQLISHFNCFGKLELQ